MTEFRKDIFTYNNQNQLEMEKLNSYSNANKIEFKPNDGIYVNGSKLSGGGGGAPVGNTRSVDMTGQTVPASTTISGIPFGKTIINFTGSNIDWVSGTSILIQYTPNPSHPYAGMDRVMPIFKTTGHKSTTTITTNLRGEFTFDKPNEIFEFTFTFLSATGTVPLTDLTIDLDYTYS